MSQDIVVPDAEQLDGILMLRDDFIDAGMRMREHHKPGSKATPEQIEQAKSTYENQLRRLVTRLTVYLPWLLEQKGLPEIREAVNNARKHIYMDLRTPLGEIQEMLAPVPYRVGCDIAARLKNIDETLIDKIGELVGECEQCGEGVFANEGYTELSEDGGMPVHDECYPKWLEANKETIKAATDDTDE